MSAAAAASIRPCVRRCPAIGTASNRAVQSRRQAAMRPPGRLQAGRQQHDRPAVSALLSTAARGRFPPRLCPQAVGRRRAIGRVCVRERFDISAAGAFGLRAGWAGRRAKPLEAIAARGVSLAAHGIAGGRGYHCNTPRRAYARAELARRELGAIGESSRRQIAKNKSRAVGQACGLTGRRLSLTLRAG